MTVITRMLMSMTPSERDAIAGLRKLRGHSAAQSNRCSAAGPDTIGWFSGFPAVSLPGLRLFAGVVSKCMITCAFPTQGKAGKIFTLSFPVRQGTGEAALPPPKPDRIWVGPLRCRLMGKDQGLSRPPTNCAAGRAVSVDARRKAGHDGQMSLNHLNGSVPTSAQAVGTKQEADELR
jgi:hypothetical protein